MLIWGKTEDEINNKKIVDYGSFYIELWELADAVRPGAWLSNKACEIALHVLNPEMEQHKKRVMPLQLASKLRTSNCIHDRFVKKHFSFSTENRLDHKEQVMFSVLQNLMPNPRDKKFTRHYYLIVLNLKAERFEIIDSMRMEGNATLKADAAAIIGSIKHLWSENYAGSNIDIQNYKTVHIKTPMQKTSFDCGFFMLKFIEAWDGRKMLMFNPSDMPVLRKLFTKKWLEWEDNKVSWLELLF